MIDDLLFYESVSLPSGYTVGYLIACNGDALLSHLVHKASECMTSSICLLLVLGVDVYGNWEYLHFKLRVKSEE